MASDFDDHSTVVVLEFMVLRLIQRQCQEASSPSAELMDWKTALGDLKAQYEQAAFGSELSDNAALNAIEIIGEIERATNELAALVRG